MDYKTKYPIGSQWECLDGSRAVVVSHFEDHVLCANEARIFKLFHDRWDSGDGWELIRPWKEKRVFEDEVWMMSKDGSTLLDLKSEFTYDPEEYGWDVIARMQFKITEGDGL